VRTRRSVTDWVIFLFVVFVTAVDDILRELLSSFTAMRDFVRYRLRWIVLEKLRSLRRGAHQ
jgi:hypothetical protein